MFDELAVQTAKFWEALRSLRAPSGLREDEFERFSLMVIGLTCVAQSPGPWLDRVNGRARTTFEALKSVARYQDENQFRQVWLDACDVLAKIFRTASQADVPRDIGSFKAFDSIARLLDHFEGTWGSRRDFLLDCFDEVFHRVVGRLTGTGYRSGDTAAALAAHLSANVDHISEYFATTGEFAVLRRTLLGMDTSARIAVIERLNFFIDLRLGLHGIDGNDQPPREDDLASFVDRGFLLVDHPRRQPTLQRPDSPRWADHQTSLEALDQLLQSRSDLPMSLIVVPSSDRSSGGWRRTLREHLVRSGRLLAVIDLPQDRRHESRKQVSAWLLGKEGQPRNHVLMVNAKGLAGKGEFREARLLMAFVAAIVSLGAQEGWPSPGFARPRQFRWDDVEAMLEAYFKNGYRDVDGVCRRVHVSELAQNAYKLVASAYIEGADKEAKGKTFMPLLNSDPVLEALRQRREHGTRIYVIGNNGEGKSILLGDLADRLVQENRRVVGISFGLTDRFNSQADQGRVELISDIVLSVVGLDSLWHAPGSNGPAHQRHDGAAAAGAADKEHAAARKHVDHTNNRVALAVVEHDIAGRAVQLPELVRPRDVLVCSASCTHEAIAPSVRVRHRSEELGVLLLPVSKRSPKGSLAGDGVTELGLNGHINGCC